MRDIECLTHRAAKVHSQSRQVMASAIMAELADLLIVSLEVFKNSRANQSETPPSLPPSTALTQAACSPSCTVMCCCQSPHLVTALLKAGEA